MGLLLLPPEVLAYVVSFCTARSILRLRRVSRTLRAFASERAGDLGLRVKAGLRSIPRERTAWFEGTVWLTIGRNEGLARCFPRARVHLTLPRSADARPRLTDGDVKAIVESAGDSLHSIDLTQAHQLTDAAVAALVTCPALEAVNLSSCDGLTDVSAGSLAACASLKSVNVMGCERLTDIAAHLFAASSSLESLDMSFCWRLTDGAAAELAMSPTLRAVNLMWCRKLTDAAAASLASLPSLRQVDLRGCRTTSKAVELLSTCPSAKVLM